MYFSRRGMSFTISGQILAGMDGLEQATAMHPRTSGLQGLPRPDLAQCVTCDAPNTVCAFQPSPSGHNPNEPLPPCSLATIQRVLSEHS